MPRTIHIAHSPDADDLFMFWALAKHKITHPDFAFQVCTGDIEELNQSAKKMRYEITAVSFHAALHLSGQYALLGSGASMAEKNWGPRLVCLDKMKQHFSDIKKIKRIAVPGLMTTAALLAKIFWPWAELVPMRFDRVMPEIQNGCLDAGVIIHEGQMFVQAFGLHELASLGDEWMARSKKMTGKILPLPLGGNVIRRDLGEKNIKTLNDLCRQSIVLAMQNRQSALAYLRRFRSDLSFEQLTTYLSWYANARTLRYHDDAIAALALLQMMAQESGALAQSARLIILD